MRRASLAPISAFLVLLGLLAVPFAPAARADDGDWLGRINQIRQASDLAPVTSNPAWVLAMQHHLAYLDGTDPSLTTGAYASTHTENPASPYYTPDGAHAGSVSDLAGAGVTPVAAIDGWLMSPFHAMPILDPQLRQVAFATTATRAALDVGDGVDPSASVPSGPVLFPANGATTDLSEYSGDERPNPLVTCEHQHPGVDWSHAGLPVFAMLPSAPAAGLSASMSGYGAGDVCVVDSETYVMPDPVFGPAGADNLSGRNAVVVIARTPLANGPHSVTLHQPGKPDLSWSFTVAKPPARAPIVTVTSSCNQGSADVDVLVRNANPTQRAHYTVTTAGHTDDLGELLSSQTAGTGWGPFPAGAVPVKVTGSDGTTVSQTAAAPRCGHNVRVAMRVRAKRVRHTLDLTVRGKAPKTSNNVWLQVLHGKKWRDLVGTRPRQGRFVLHHVVRGKGSVEVRVVAGRGRKLLGFSMEKTLTLR